MDDSVGTCECARACACANLRVLVQYYFAYMNVYVCLHACMLACGRIRLCACVYVCICV